MRRTSACLTTLVIGIVSVGVPGARANAVTNRLAVIASGGVVSVRDAVGIRTGFRLGGARLVVAASDAASGIRLISADGSTATVGSEASLGNLVITGDGGLTLEPLVESRSGLRSGAAVYVLGGPLGYGQRIQRVVLRQLRRSGSDELVASGRLSRRLEGGPVVTPGGLVVGAVAAVGTGEWTLAPVATLRLLLSRAHSPNGGGLSIVLVVCLALVLCLGACGTLIAVVRRRARQRRPTGTQRALPESDGAPAGVTVSRRERPREGPLVQRREPGGAGRAPDDFEIVLKRQGEAE